MRWEGAEEVGFDIVFQNVGAPNAPASQARVNDSFEPKGQDRQQYGTQARSRALKQM
jgi:hypothetical protein